MAEEIKSILIVDDEPDILKLVEIRLRNQHYAVLTAIDGLEGLRMFQRHEPDLVLLDIMMPKLDGFEFLDRIKTMKVKKFIPIIMFSAKVRAEDIEKAKTRGAWDYILKPFTAEELIAKIKKAFESLMPEANA
ncbi:MAG: response regulator transcription factor [Candidatus Omnitrophota bacterium]